MAEKQRLSESNTIILSLHDRWWGKILAGEKLLEIRKTRPVGKGSYRVLVYVTGTGEIKGEFVCKDFLKIPTIQEIKDREVQKGSCLTGQQLKEYAGYSPVEAPPPPSVAFSVTLFSGFISILSAVRPKSRAGSPCGAGMCRR